MPRRSATVLSFLLLSFSAAPAQVVLESPRRLDLFQQPWNVAGVDADRDGILDVVSSGLDGLSIFRGAGNGFFFLRKDALDGSYFFGLAVADLDLDGDPDFAATDYVGGGLYVTLGDGAGGFETTIGPVATSPSPSANAAADVSGDGLADLAVVSWAANTLAVFENSGAGAFFLALEVPVAAGPSGVTAGDLDGDGHADLVVACRTAGVLSIHFADGAGGLRGAAEVPLPILGTTPVLADMDGDGRLDVIVASFVAPDIVLLRGDGAGGFGPPVVVATGAPARGIAVADANGDGRLDAALSNSPGPDSGGDVATVLLAGETGVPKVSSRLPVEPNARGIDFGDFDGDGWIDVAVASNLRRVIDVFRGDGTGSFSPPRTIPAVASHVVAADVDRDRHLDLVMSNVESWLGDGAGGFSRVPSDYFGPELGEPVFADFDEDGLTDIVGTVSREQTMIRMHVNRGNGRFEVRRQMAVPHRLSVVLAGDFDGDSLADVGVLSEIDSTFTIFAGDGAFGFGPPHDSPVPPRTLDALAEDLDGDGALEVATASDRFDRLLIFGSDGSGGIEPIEEIPLSFSPQVVASGRFFRHDKVDLLVGTSTAFTLLRDDGGGRYVPVQTVTGVSGLDVAVAADFDGDEVEDLALVGSPDVTVGHPLTILLSDENGLLGSPRLFPILSGYTPFNYTAADFSGDGLADIVIPNSHWGRTSILLNESLDPLDVRRGNVNGAAGGIADVLFVNCSPGIGPERRLLVERAAPFEIRVDAPPSMPAGPAPFAVNVWTAEPTRRTITRLPLGVGRIALPVPIDPSRTPQPRFVSNNLPGKGSALGSENWPGGPTRSAPTVLLSLATGLRARGRFFLQGVILDPAAPNGLAAVTNGVLVVSQ